MAFSAYRVISKELENQDRNQIFSGQDNFCKIRGFLINISPKNLKKGFAVKNFGSFFS